MKTAVKSDRNPVQPLSKEVVGLRKTVTEKDQQLEIKSQQIEKKDQQIAQLLDYIQLLRQKQFGRSSEKVSKDQINLFDESELEHLLIEHDEVLPETTPPESSPQTPIKKQKPIRRPLPAHLKRIEKIIDVTDEEKSQMKDDWTFIGYESAEQLAVIPRQHYVIVTKRAKYAPNHENIPGAEQGIKTAARPDQIIPKSIASASVIADVITAKFVDGLPLYRQEKTYQRDGIDLSRQTMSGWVIQLEEQLTPLMHALKKALYKSQLLHIDETRLQVMNEPNKDNTQLSYMWVYKGGPPEQPIIWFEYSDSRQSSVPIDFLTPENGESPEDAINIMTDGYAGYNALSKMPCIKNHAVCWAHARRKFVEASQGRKNTAAAHQMVSLIAKLYQIEREAKDQTAEQRKSLRHEKAVPILNKIKQWLDNKADKAIPKSLLGKAVHYTLNLWPKLTVYLTDGHIPIDNNAAENAIRPFVIGRKAWLFSGSPRGARASAVLYSLIETAKANGLEPRAYLTDLFERLPKAKSEKALNDLLPMNIKIADLVREGK